MLIYAMVFTNITKSDKGQYNPCHQRQSTITLSVLFCNGVVVESQYQLP